MDRKPPGTNRSGLDGAPRLSSIADDELLRGILRYFHERTGVAVTFQEAHGYTAPAEGGPAEYCSILAARNRCGLLRPEVEMPIDPGLRHFHSCLGGIGHIVIPVLFHARGGPVRELGRLVSEPIAIRPTQIADLLPEARSLQTHPDTLTAAAQRIREVDRAELEEFCRLVDLVLERVATERADRARSLAVAAAFEEVGMHGSREVIRDLLAALVRDFSDADAVILSTRATDDGPLQHQAAFSEALSREERRLLMNFAAEVVKWISQTGNPISFPDLGGSAWRHHVLDGHELEGSLVAVPVKMPGDWRGWWTAYYRRPTAQMEDQLHRLSVLAAHSTQTLTFVSQLETSEAAAMTDSLTRLGNRRFLYEQLERELARSSRGRYPVSMVILDIDDFKRINDEHGHRVGDEALKLVAEALRQPLRRSNTICRYGGDEFCVVIPECTTEEALGVATRLREEVAKVGLDVGGGAMVHLRMSAGVATHDPAQPATADLFEMADEALLSAKRAGKDRVLVSTPRADPT